jgi:GTP-binding protein
LNASFQPFCRENSDDVRRDDIRNIVIIAHVDHGKTTLVDCLLRQSGQFRENQLRGERILDSHDLERERGITILAKNISIPYRGVKINVIDTPGHADFGGEVERVVRMADGALVLVDAAEGPMPQTRYVLDKALEAGLVPIIVVNKIDRPDARPQQIVDGMMELLLDLDAEQHFEDFVHIFASSKEGYATLDPARRTDSMQPLLDIILKHVPGPTIDTNEPTQMLVTTLDWSEYHGRIAVGKLRSGTIHRGQQLVLMKDKSVSRAKASGVFVFENLGRTQVEEATAGDIVAVMGLEDVEIGDTIAAAETQSPLPRLRVDQPTLEMVFSVNNSPLAGLEGKYVTTRQLRERLLRELERNVALQVRPLPEGDAFAVTGRGVMHLSVLIETMRREGYELSVGKPRVVTRQEGEMTLEPFESLVVEIPSERLGTIIELVGQRRGEMISTAHHGDYTLATFSIPARGLIGFRTRALNATQGTAIIHHRFDKYRQQEGDIPKRPNGVLISMNGGKAVGFALFNLQDRAELFVKPGDAIYEGMIVGENSRGEDMVVNPMKEKKLTNIRAAGSDENILLKPPRDMSLEVALEYIEEDELVEITPAAFRLRKIVRKESDRRRISRAKRSPQSVSRIRKTR